MFIPFPGGINGRERELNNKQTADNRRNVGIGRGLLGGLGDGLKSAEDHLTTLVEDVKQTTADATGVIGVTEKGNSLVHDVGQVGQDGVNLVNGIATPVFNFVTSVVGDNGFVSLTQDGSNNGDDNSQGQGLPTILPSLPTNLPPLTVILPPLTTILSVSSPPITLPTSPTIFQPPPNNDPTNTITNTPDQTGAQIPTGSSDGSGNGDRGSGNSDPVGGGGSRISNGGDAHQTARATQSLPPVVGTVSTNSVGENSGSSTRTSAPTNIASAITSPVRGGMVAAAATALSPPLFSTSGSVTFTGTVITTTDASGESYATTLYHTYTPTNPSSPTSNSTKPGSSKPGALIGGIVVGVIAFLVLMIAVIICLVRKRRTARKLSLSNPSLSNPYPFSATDAAFSGGFEDSPPATPRADSFLTSSDLRSSRPGTAMELPDPRSRGFISRLLTPTERQSVVSRSEPDAFLAVSRRSSVSMGMAISRWSSASTDTPSFRTVPDTSEKDGNDHNRWSHNSDALSFHTTPEIDEEKSTVRGSFSSILGPLNSSPSLVVLKDPFADPEDASLPYRDPSIVA
ncbi:hypothetical protein PM082_003653 [Marasmius tenuissimus]|nr:hypothetical protein PM082_003653 [Marasmius tenuissimus]